MSGFICLDCTQSTGGRCYRHATQTIITPSLPSPASSGDEGGVSDRQILLDAAEKYEAEARELVALFDGDERMGDVSRERAQALRRLASLRSSLAAVERERDEMREAIQEAHNGRPNDLCRWAVNHWTEAWNKQESQLTSATSRISELEKALEEITPEHIAALQRVIGMPSECPACVGAAFCTTHSALIRIRQARALSSTPPETGPSA